MAAYMALFVSCGLFWLLLPTVLNWYQPSAETALLTKRMVLAHKLGAVLAWPLTSVLPSSMRAAGDVRFAMRSPVIPMSVFRLGAAYLLARSFSMGALGVWLAMLCGWGFRGVAFSIRWLTGGWKNKCVIN